MNPAALGYRAGQRRGRLLLIHNLTGWRISLPATELGDLARTVLHHAAQARTTGAGVAIFRTPADRREVAELMRRIPRPR